MAAVVRRQRFFLRLLYNPFIMFPATLKGCGNHYQSLSTDFYARYVIYVRTFLNFVIVFIFMRLSCVIAS